MRPSRRSMITISVLLVLSGVGLPLTVHHLGPGWGPDQQAPTPPGGSVGDPVPGPGPDARTEAPAPDRFHPGAGDALVQRLTGIDPARLKGTGEGEGGLLAALEQIEALSALGTDLDGTDAPVATDAGEHQPVTGQPTVHELLALAATQFGVDATAYPSVAESHSLAAALDRFAAVTGQTPLADHELDAVLALDPVLQQDLAPLVDALSYATQLQRSALHYLAPSERAEVFELSVRAAEATAGGSALSPGERDRFEELSERIDLPALVHAGRVLTEATLETRDRLRTDLVERPGLAELAITEGGGPDKARRTALAAHHAARTDGHDARAKVRAAADVLRAQAETTRPIQDLHADISVQQALLDLVTSRFPQAGPSVLQTSADGTPLLSGLDALDRLPPELSTAIAVLALASAHDPNALVPDASAAATIAALDGVAEALPTLQAWSYLLRATPPDSHFWGPNELHERTANAALAAPAQSRTVEGLLRLAATRGGLALPPSSSHANAPALEALPGPGDALGQWYRTFGLDQQLDAQSVDLHELRAAADALPDALGQALVLLLDGQVRAANTLDGARLTPNERHLLHATAPVVEHILQGGPATPEIARTLAQFNALATRETHAALEAAVILATATDRASDVLRAAGVEPPGAPATTASGHGDGPTPDDPESLANPGAPGPDDIDPPGPPAIPAQPQAGPFSDPDQDVWFLDPTELIVITGQAGTVHAPGFHAIALDLGGDDTRHDAAGGVTSNSPTPFAVSIDLGGDDHYESEQAHVQGAAAMLDGAGATFPIGILLDHHGDDTYQGGPFSQGSAYQGGLGLLVDLSGHDTYTVSGELRRSPAGFRVEGGQGYALHAPADHGTAAPPAIGALADAKGHDTYRALSGQGAALAIGERELPPGATRAAIGLIAEGTGDDTYDCTRICIGHARFATPTRIECEPGDGCATTDDNGDERPGIVAATGVFLDTGGQDNYRADRGANDHIHPDTSGIFVSRPATSTTADPTQAGLRVNVSVFADIGVTDSNGDLVPDHVAHVLGHDPTDPRDGPIVRPLATLDPTGVVAGEDTDGDGFSDAAEARFGTDPFDNRSAPVVLPEALGGPSGPGGDGLIVDIALELTTGSSATSNTLAETGVGPERQRIDGTGTDGTRIGLLGIGDTDATNWHRDYIVALDLGGNDRYSNNAGASLNPFARIELSEGNTYPPLSAVALDLDGDDRYEAAPDTAAQGSALAGSYGILVDVAGNDAYLARRAAQAAALGPGATAVLLELAGDDMYTAEDAAQGYGVGACEDIRRHVPDAPCGGQGRAIALLYDHNGTDTYVSRGQALLEAAPATPVPFLTYPSTPALQQFPGPHGSRPHGEGYPYPQPSLGAPNGDLVLFLELNGTDTYRVPGPRDPTITQGFNARPVPVGHSLAFFLDASGADRYLQEMPNGTVQRDAKNAHLLVRGVPGTPEATDGPAIFLDAEYDPAAQDRDKDAFPDLVESLAGNHPRPGSKENRTALASLNPSRGTVLDLSRLGVLVGGRLDNVYDEAFPLVVDLGGDDHYRAAVGAGLGDPYTAEARAFGTAVALDMGGSDTYERRVVDDGVARSRILEATSFGAGLFGIGVLVDDGGSNTFEATIDGRLTSARPSLGLSQGAGFQGVGVLVLSNQLPELDPDPFGPSLEPRQPPADQYNRLIVSLRTDAPDEFALPGLGLSQGAGFKGLGLLVVEGDQPDHYDVAVEPLTEARAASQGHAPEGIGVLHDTGGDNTFRATGLAQGSATLLGGPGSGLTQRPSEGNQLHQTRDWALGMLLATGAGNDTYELTTQGQAHTVGLDRYALLLDVAGNDHYRATPPANGAWPALAQAVAQTGGTSLLVDLEGDDTYEAGSLATGESVAQAVAYPGPVNGATLALLADLRGHDTYRAGHTAQAAATAPNGAAFLIEPTGDDVYTATGQAQGASTGNNPALFLDGGGADQYVPLLQSARIPIPCLDEAPCLPKSRANDAAWTQGRGAGVDAPALDIALRASSLLLGQGGRTAVNAHVQVLEATLVDGEPTCTDQVLTTRPDQPAAGTLCVRVTLNGTERSSTLAGTDLRVERIRVLTLNPEAPPGLVHEFPGTDETVYTAPWDTAQAAFIDGEHTLLARVELSQGELATGGGPQRAADGALVVDDQRTVHLDNVPTVVIDVPTWLQPDTGGPLEPVVHVSGEPAGSTVELSATLEPVELTGGAPPTSASCAALDNAPSTTVEIDDAFDGASWVPSWDPTACPEGRYVINVTATTTLADGTIQAGTTTSPTLGLDRTPPITVLQLPSHVNSTLGASGGFPVAWNATDPFGVPLETVLEVRRGSNWVAWPPVRPTNGSDRWESFADGETLDFRARTTDLAGNVEDGPTAQVTVDLTLPQLQDPRVTPTHVRSGAPVTFRVNASDEDGIAAAFVEIDGTRYGLTTAFTQGAGEHQGYRYDGWSSVTRQLVREHGPENASRQEGYAFRFLVQDAAGNTARSAEQQVFLDDVPPELVNATIVYPRGTAAGPGDLVRVVIEARDNLKLAETVSLDVTSVSTAEEVDLRLDPATGNFTGVVLLDRTPGATDPVLLADLRDAAGSVTKVELPVELAGIAPRLDDVRVTDRTPTSAVARWTTDIPSTGRLVVTDPDLGDRTTFDTPATPTTEHALELTGLSPAVRYVATLVPANAAGGTGAPQTLTFQLPSAINGTIATPAPGDILARQASVRWNASDPTGQPLDTEMRLVSTDPLLPFDTALTHVRVPAATLTEHALETTTIPDGPYRLELLVTRGRDHTTFAVDELTIDNTPPVVRLLDPEPGDTVPAGKTLLRAAAVDPLAGIDASTVHFLVDGQRVDATPATDGTWTARVELADDGRPYMVTARASDRAGNTAQDGGPLFVDDTPPEEATLRVLLPDGRRAARPGDDVTVTVTVTTLGQSDAPLRPGDHATIAPSPVTGDASVELVPMARAHQGTFRVPAELSEGTYRLDIHVSDPAGNTRTIAYDLPVDTRAPTVTASEAIVTGRRDAHVELCASEPVDAHLAYRALQATAGRDVDAGDVVSDRTRGCHLLHLTGLRPGHDYELTATVTDGAGHETVHAMHVVTDRDEIGPGAASALQAATPVDRVVQLTWTPASDDVGLLGYRVLRYEGNAGWSEQVGFVPADGALRFIDRSARPGITYRYAVSAVDLAGNEGPPTRSVTITALGVPELSSGRVTPEMGHAEEPYRFEVDYRGPPADDLRIHVVVDGVPHAMTLAPGTPSEACFEACTFVRELTLAAESLGDGGHQYAFTAQVGSFTTAHPEGGRPVQGPIVTVASADADVPTATLIGGGLLAALAAFGLAAAYVLRRPGGGS